MGRIRAPGIFALVTGLAIAAGAAVAQEGPEDCGLEPVQIFARMADKVVQVNSIGVDPFRVLGRVHGGTGSGIVLRPDLVLTNYHVVRKAKLIGVGNGREFADAVVIGSDPALDIALLGVTPPLQSPGEVAFAPTDELVVGQTVFTLGYPLGIGKSMASGIISGLDRQIPLNTTSWTTRYIQTDAAVSAGNSGGALIDTCGRVVGMVALRSPDPAAENLGYALPADTILPVLEEIETTGRVARPWHGIFGQMMDPLLATMMGFFAVEPNGFLVETVEPGSAADAAGIRGGTLPVLWGMREILLGGDVITAVDGKRIATLEDAISAVSALEIGASVELTVWREGMTFQTTAHLKERPQFEQDLWEGPPD